MSLSSFMRDTTSWDHPYKLTWVPSKEVLKPGTKTRLEHEPWLDQPPKTEEGKDDESLSGRVRRRRRDLR